MPAAPRWWRKLLRRPPTVALALGSGGARGLAHIPVLEALDELGVKPVAIAGASIGAVIGSGYAAGMSGREIRDYAEATLYTRADVVRRVLSLQLGDVRKRFTESHSLRGLLAELDAAVIAEEFLPHKVPRQFADLRIPLYVVPRTPGTGWSGLSIPERCVRRLPDQWRYQASCTRCFTKIAC